MKEGTLADDIMVYVRSRWGELNEVRVSEDMRKCVYGVSKCKEPLIPERLVETLRSGVLDEWSRSRFPSRGVYSSIKELY